MTMECIQLVEATSHCDSRPEHAAWQGRCYSLKGDTAIGNAHYPDFCQATQYGSVTGLMGASCRHAFGPYRHGTKRAYEPDPKHPSGVPGNEIYEMEQKQRYLERQIRADKRDLRGAQQLYEKDPSLTNKTALIKAQEQLRKRQAAMREFIKESNSKGKPGTTILTRKPNREWAGDMPKGVKAPAAHRKVDTFLNQQGVKAQMKTAGISKTRMRAEISAEMMRRSGTAADFASLTAKEQRGIFDKIKNAIDPHLPSTKKANDGKHAVSPFTAASSIEEALEFAAKEFGIDKFSTMYKEIGLSGANLINEAIGKIRNTLGSIELRDIRYKPTLCGNVNVIAAYNPAWNGLFFSKAIKSKNAAKRMKELAQNSHKKGWWSTGEEFTVINHEMGHYAHNRLDGLSKKTACDHYLDLILNEQRNKAASGKTINWTKWSKGEELDAQVVRNACENGLSGYALSNIEEMVAESFARLYDGNVSETAKSILKTLLDHAANINRVDNALLKRRLESICS